MLVCRPDPHQPAAVLRLTGTLDLVTADALRQAVSHSLAAQPDRLLLDATGLGVGDPLGLAALGALVGQNEDWPRVPIVLCGASPGIAAAGLTYAPDLETALADPAPAPPRVRARLRPVPDACRQVRHLVTAACEAWRRSEPAEVATLIATELVANVVRHARTTMEFTLGLRDGRLTMSVRDGSRRMPKPVGAAPVSSPGGRGLWLVRDLSEAWGVLPVTDGKVVWTRLSA
jgi:anti-anti-sigma regulatory factor